MQAYELSSTDSIDGTMVPDLPTIIQVHFADLSAPLIQSANSSAPPPVATAPAFLSQFLSENSRWASMKNAASAIMDNPDCPRKTPRAVSLAAGASAPAARALPVILRVRGPANLRVRLERSLKSDHVGTLQHGVAFAFNQVGEGWAKLSPMHYSDLQTSRDRCDISDFKPHNLEKNGYCITSVDGRDIFDEPNEEQKADVLARYSKFQSETPADSAAASCAAAPAVAQELPARWTWPSDRPPSNIYSDDGECVNMTMYVSLAVPLLQSRDSRLHWARFLRCALYFAYATSAPQQCSKRTLLLQVFMFTVMNSRALARNITVGVVAGS